MELREKLAHFSRDNIALFDCDGECPDEVAIKAEAGIDIRSPDYCNYCFANKILALIREAGYAKLSDDQSLPELPPPVNLDYREGYLKSHEDKLQAGFRRVEL